MALITAADVSKLRKITGAGMMDCKKALTEADGNFERAQELIRERGLAIANKRADREASEGAVLSCSANDKKAGVVIALNCETDFVAKNQDFIALANDILKLAVEKLPADLDALKSTKLGNKTVEEIVLERSGITGEKMELAYYDFVKANYVAYYIHMGNKLATIAGFNQPVDEQVGKDVAMQIAAMDPVAVDKDDVPQHIIEKELEIGREQARNDGKPENMLDKIALGKLNKFFKDSTLLNQEFVKDSKKTIAQYLHEQDKNLTVTAFKRFGLKN
ncbi:MAG: elongation factor Ts [Bacteroidales bacterium]|nr:elongation factor Ts [Bacteroidales bacterium]HOY37790.1 translation elongation factor Ts [Bacteroidales bacterium]HQP03574.1 translation elongation factor Ts [Bacteroidales bacterium]